MSIKLKGCPKCGGDVRIDHDEYGWFEQCIQCGYTRDLETITAHPEKDKPQKGKKWRLGRLELGPIEPFTLPSEEERSHKKAGATID
jgi:hypothetical protein